MKPRSGISRCLLGEWVRYDGEPFPSLPIDDEERLRAPELRRAFFDRVLAFHSGAR